MMEVTKSSSRQLDKFKPEQAGKRNAQADSVIQYARKIKDWSLLQRAIEEKISDQIALVTWWDENVTPRLHSGRGKMSADRRTIISLAQAEELTGIANQQVSKWRKRLQDTKKYQEMLFGVTYARAMASEAPSTTALKWTGDPESYTPGVYIEAARQVMGSIDLDPASNELAQQTVKASVWYGEKINGLLQPWVGNVFLNPPYSHPEIAQFIEKLCNEYGSKHIQQAILLTNNNTDTRWWHRSASMCSRICFTAGRINFYKSDGSTTQPTNGQNFFYFGKECSRFKSIFSDHGFIMGRMD